MHANTLYFKYTAKCRAAAAKVVKQDSEPQIPPHVYVYGEKMGLFWVKNICEMK